MVSLGLVLVVSLLNYITLRLVATSWYTRI